MCVHAYLDGNMYVSQLCVQRDCLSMERSLLSLGLAQPSQAAGHKLVIPCILLEPGLNVEDKG